MDDLETAAEADDRPTTFTQRLREPVEIGGVSVEELTVKEPTAGQWKTALERQGFESTICLIALCGGVAPALVREMPISVVQRAGEFLLSFLETGQTTNSAS